LNSNLSAKSKPVEIKDFLGFDFLRKSQPLNISEVKKCIKRGI